MSKKISTASIGLFLVTGLALGVGGLLLFSSANLFSKTRDVIVYFNESLNGLDQGAPLKYRGVKIGTVKRVMVRFNQATNDYSMPVICEVEDRLVKERMGEPTEIFTDHIIAERITLGLRASLQTESLVTGVLYIDVRLNPHAPPAVFHQLKKIYTEIPTEPTRIQQLFNNLSSLDLKGVETNLNSLLTKLDAAVTELRLAQISQGITNLLVSADRLVSSAEVTNSLAAIRTTLEQYRRLGEKLNSGVDPLVASLTNSLAEADRALAAVRGAGESIRSMLEPDTPVRVGLDQALQQLASAGQSIASFIEFLKRNPNALIVGREIIPKKP